MASAGAEAMGKCPFSGVSFLDPKTFTDPFDIYEELREERPVSFDESMSMYVVTRHEDVRAVFADPETFSSSDRDDKAFKAAANERSMRNLARFQEEGWVYEANVGYKDDPVHKEVRKIFDQALGGTKVRDMEPYIAATADELLDAIKPGEVHEIVHDLATPLPLRVICNQAGANPDDIWTIKGWCDEIFKRMSFVQPEDEEQISITKELDAQRYFMKIIYDLRQNPNDTILSNLINTPIAGGRLMTDGEALSSLLHTVFVAGSETTTFATASAIKVLCEQPGLFERMKGASDRDIRQFCEEVLRVEFPAVTVFRVSTRDVHLGGADIPANSVVALKLGAANRDRRQYDNPEKVDLDRKNTRSHLAFGFGIHACAGAQLARIELFVLFKKIFERFSGVEFAEQHGQIQYRPHIVFRAIDKLYVRFKA